MCARPHKWLTRAGLNSLPRQEQISCGTTDNNASPLAPSTPFAYILEWAIK